MHDVLAHGSCCGSHRSSACSACGHGVGMVWGKDRGWFTPVDWEDNIGSSPLLMWVQSSTGPTCTLHPVSVGYRKACKNLKEAQLLLFWPKLRILAWACGMVQWPGESVPRWDAAHPGLPTPRPRAKCWSCWSLRCSQWALDHSPAHQAWHQAWHARHPVSGSCGWRDLGRDGQKPRYDKLAATTGSPSAPSYSFCTRSRSFFLSDGYQAVLFAGGQTVKGSSPRNRAFAWWCGPISRPTPPASVIFTRAQGVYSSLWELSSWP